MIEAMRTLALDYLVQELAGYPVPQDPEQWYQEFRKNSPGRMFPYLVEDSGRIEKVYLLEEKATGVVELTVQDMIHEPGGSRVGCTQDKLPFIKPPGSQSPQMGPVIKRSYQSGKSGPSAKILNTTMKSFAEIASDNKPWSSYFKQIVEILSAPRLKLVDHSTVDWQQEGYANLLDCVVQRIGPEKNTVFLAVKDRNGRLPGEVSEYIDYLLGEKLAGERYVTSEARAQEDGECPLCNATKVTVFPNALKGAGINFKNTDRIGVFPGVNPAQAWKGYALCGACADLLYVYKHHVIKKGGPNKDRQFFGSKIAGDSALVIPVFFPGLAAEVRQELLSDVTDYINNMNSNVTQDEESLLDILKDEKSILSLIFLWADVGQNLENVTGMIHSVLPSRLRELSLLNEASRNWHHPLFPNVPLAIETADFRPDLSLRALKVLFYRPGGKKAKDINASKQLFQVKKQLAACVYHRTPVLLERFWQETITTARWHWLEASQKKDGYTGLLYEGTGKNGSYLTPAGWIKHVNWWLYYFKQVGVMEMEKQFYKPAMAELQPYFGSQSGIDTPEKAYAFLLGVLYGRLLMIQGGKGVNVGANALTWLKRLTLKGKDLPELYTKIRSKILAYEAEKSQAVRELITEISTLGIALGDNIKLSEVQTNYYLLLGQAMTTVILSKKTEKENEA
ncbi:hypothetical protein Dred_0536 [Desulforamulus reducens MI-1]|uniref:CRISPR-associated protein n=1 Tax=Desulforamulus reducens (strain ATCC BAA-1160 / DSM 100696 / MI-1) TaxID=349161 RepID=A4J1X7_DESRM|nr:TM1802 family CRISPR-associated protein [Desulforamulus reducens]ABO49080.1 hypothetical protein Dred_0536 [Desulforamulus reducens MI-1]